jgi:hypothetical protein
MEIPRELCHTNANYQQTPQEGRIVEAGDVESKVVMYGAGEVISDEEAKRYGVDTYLQEHPQPAAAPLTVGPSAEAKAVEQTTVEDKAVEPEAATVEEGSPPTETRRTGGGRRP